MKHNEIIVKLDEPIDSLTHMQITAYTTGDPMAIVRLGRMTKKGHFQSYRGIPRQYFLTYETNKQNVLDWQQRGYSDIARHCEYVDQLSDGLGWNWHTLNRFLIHAVREMVERARDFAEKEAQDANG